MTLKSLTKTQEDVIDALAHVHAAAQLSRGVEGMEGFFNHYLETALKIWERFRRRIPEIHRDLARMMKEEGWDKGGNNAEA